MTICFNSMFYFSLWGPQTLVWASLLYVMHSRTPRSHISCLQLCDIICLETDLITTYSTSYIEPGKSHFTNFVLL